MLHVAIKNGKKNRKTFYKTFNKYNTIFENFILFSIKIVFDRF